MIIKGIEYNFRLSVEDANGNELANKLFPDLESMNAFIEETECLPEYEDATGHYVMVEVVDGVPDESGRYVVELDPYTSYVEEEFEDIMYDIEQFFIDMKEIGKLLSKNQELSYKEPTGDGAKRYPLSDIVYICPRCFNELKECRCDEYPYYLVQIDRLIAPTIRKLNIKGYTTTGCCNGHPDRPEGSYGTGIYISFKERYEFGIPLPDGAKIRKEGGLMICYDFPKGASKADLEEYQAASLEKLALWADALPDRRAMRKDEEHD